MFTKAIVRIPGKSFIYGLTSAKFGTPDYETALAQHKSYQDALRECGLDVTVLAADEKYPDSTFVEDTALLTLECAVITNPGAPSRKGEIMKMRETLHDFYSEIEEISSPGTLEAGDVLAIDSHYYIGLSERTNIEGANQLIQILNRHGMTGSVIEIDNLLHLKTGVSYLDNNHLLVGTEFEYNPKFDSFKKIVVPDTEAYAANCIWINGTVLVSAGYPITSQKIKDLGYSILDLEMSEFQKLDGGLSCLSLRF